MMTMTASEVQCTVCGGYDDDDHRKNRQHPFTGPDQPDWVPPAKPKKPQVEKTEGPVTRQMVMLPQPDLALRSLLVAKGVITNQELKEAEDALRFPGGSDQVSPDGGNSR